MGYTVCVHLFYKYIKLIETVLQKIYINDSHRSKSGSVRHEWFL